MIRVDWLSIVSYKSQAAYDWSVIKYAGVKITNNSINEKQRPAALTNKKQEDFDQIYAI
jgi:hypothetical protein